MKKFFLLLVLIFRVISLDAQTAVGTTGLLNIPRATPNTDGTFMFGGSFLPQQLTPDYFNYNTGNYFLNITFLPFLEISYTLTFLKVNNKDINQDRSISARLYCFKEKRTIPAVAIGINDLKGTSFYKAAYVVATKHFHTNYLTFSISTGITARNLEWQGINGLFTGITMDFNRLKGLQIVTEYDSRVINAGVLVTLFNHLQLTAFAYDLKYVVGGLSYKIYLSKQH